MDPLKLIALDAEDLDILSAHLQDAVVKVGDMTFLPAEKRFALVANRFDRSEPGADPPQRRRAALHFERVTRARRAGFRAAPEVVLNLLAVRFEATDAPAGVVTLTFSGAAAVALDVECVEAALRDLGPVWAARAVPRHDD